jgi:hypothetical protein
MYLEDDGAEPIYVCKNSDNTLDIDNYNFTQSEALKLAKFIQENFGG